jgi:hypothetical protein
LLKEGEIVISKSSLERYGNKYLRSHKTEEIKAIIYLFLLVYGRIRICTNITDLDTGGHKTYGSYKSGTAALVSSRKKVYGPFSVLF